MSFWKPTNPWTKKGAISMSEPATTPSPVAEDTLQKNVSYDTTITVVAPTPVGLIFPTTAPQQVDLQVQPVTTPQSIDALRELVGKAIESVVTDVTNRTLGMIAAEFETAVTDLEELSVRGDAHYETWLKTNEERLRAQAARDLKNLVAEAAKHVSRLESEMASASTSLTRRLLAVRSAL